MKINSSTITMKSVSQQRTTSKKTESLTAWIGNRPNEQNQVKEDEKLKGFKELIKKMKDAATYDMTDMTSQVRTVDEGYLTISEEDEKKIELLNKLLEALTGKKIKFVKPEKIILKQNDLPVPTSGQPTQIQSLNRPVLKGWGLNYQKSEYYSEEEAMSFTSTGSVTTTDGRTIQFGINLNLSRSFVQQSNLSIKAGDALIDPLVINFEQPTAALTKEKYSFDLDLDGKNDQISFVKPGSGFLAYDKNGNGIINDGSELFGPKTGNGFAELSNYDQDGNNWIDENDDIYDKLRIWTKDENGQDQLFALGQKRIGAIYLGAADSQFSLKNESNSTQGQIKQTGIFLKEDGNVGTIQHIDISL